jgi:hypothetical protein
VYGPLGLAVPPVTIVHPRSHQASVFRVLYDDLVSLACPRCTGQLPPRVFSAMGA